MMPNAMSVPPLITWTPEKGYGVVGLGCGLPTRGDDATVLGPVKHKPLSRGPLALLDRPCARRPAEWQVGTAGWSALDRTSGWIMRRSFPAGDDGRGSRAG